MSRNHREPFLVEFLAQQYAVSGEHLYSILRCLSEHELAVFITYVLGVSGPLEISNT